MSQQYLYTTQDLSNQIQQLQANQPLPPLSLVNNTIFKEPKTSSTHPINISWIIPPDILELLRYHDFPSDLDLYDFLSPKIKEQFLAKSNNSSVVKTPKGNLCLSSCPGKKVRLSGPVRGRAAINRDLDLDFARMKNFGITMLVCCLDDTELDFLGASWSKYEESARIQGLQIIRLPMIEGGCPQTLSEVREAVKRVNVEIHKGNHVLVHCRGGVGRAGLFAACWLLENNLVKSVERAVYILREQRSPKAIETITQVEYLIKYSMALNLRLGKKLQKTQVDLSGEIVLRTPNGAPSIPLIAKLENEVLVDPEILKDDLITSPLAATTAVDYPWW